MVLLERSDTSLVKRGRNAREAPLRHGVLRVLTYNLDIPGESKRTRNNYGAGDGGLAESEKEVS